MSTDRSAQMIIEVSDGPKMLRETLCIAQTWMGLSQRSDRQTHIDRLQRLIDECDRHRPLGPDGKHGDRHTDTCGCEGPMSTDHRVWTSDPDDDDRVRWECSCGVAGSCPDFRAAVASDDHIAPGESRSDISKPDW